MKGRLVFLAVVLLLLVAPPAHAYRYTDSDPYKRVGGEHSKPTAIRVYFDADPHTHYDHLGVRNNYNERLSCSRDYVRYARCKHTFTPYRKRYGSVDPTKTYYRIENGDANFYHNRRTDNIEGRHYLYSKHKPLPKDPVMKKDYTNVVFTKSQKHNADDTLHRQAR